MINCRYCVAFALVGALNLGGCGTYTPDIQEFWGTSGDTDKKLELIVEQVKCELRRAARLVIAADIEYGETGQGRQLQFLETDWGADILFQFTIDEKSSVNPGIAFTPPLPNAIITFPGAAATSTPQSRSFGLGGTLSSEGYRQDKLHLYYKLSDLVGPDDALPSKSQIAAEQCITKENANATLFLQSDLKFYEWLQSVVNLHTLKEGNLALKNAFAKDGVVSHDIKFEIVSSGNFTPTWKLVRVAVNTGSSTFLNAGRDRAQEVIITLGPVGSGAVQTSILASSIKAGIDSTANRIGQ